MAYRRKQGITRSSTFKEEVYHPHHHNLYQRASSDDLNHENHLHLHHHNNNNPQGSLAARAMRASAAHRDTSGYAYAYASSDPTSTSSPTSSSPAYSCASFSHRDPPPHSLRSPSHSKGPYLSDGTSMKDTNDSKYGFWGILARKAKSILDEDDFESSNRVRSQLNDPTKSGAQFYQSRQSSQDGTKMDNAKLRKRLDAITSSLNHLGDTIGNAFEEGRTIVEHKTADIIQETRNKTSDILQETRKIQVRRRGGSTDSPDQATVLQNTSWQRPVIQPVQTNALAYQETQLKASRDVAMATAAKAKVLLRELKTVKADLAFAKERCAQLEEENKRLRESREKGDNPADDDLIRLQLETLLAEKARLAHENSIYARENRFLREIVEYHQLTMQDIVYLDEGAEEVTEVYPFSFEDAKVLSSTPTSPISPTFFPEIVSSLSMTQDMKEHPQVQNDVTTTNTYQSSPPTPSCLPETEESPEVPSSQRMEKEHSQTSINKPPNNVGEDRDRQSVPSA